MTPTRREILRALEEMSERYPHWRFGKLVANISYWAKGPTAEAIWDVEDEEFLRGIKSHLEQRTERPHSTTSEQNRVPGRNIDALSYEITRHYPGKHIIYSEDEQRVIGAGDTMEEASQQAEASGVRGLWHYGYGEKPDEYIV